MLCVVIRTLRLCVSLREIFLPHAECAEIAEVYFVLAGAVRSLRLCALCESFSVGLTQRARRARRGGGCFCGRLFAGEEVVERLDASIVGFA
jgi:hypothetical protein